MTKKEAQQKMQEKVQVITNMCKQLEIEIKSVQRLNENNILENIVFFTDLQKYDISDEKAPEAPVETVVEPEITQKNDQA